MKKITSILAFVLALAWVSCTPEALTTINEITDHYTAPEGAIELTTLSKAEYTWSLDRRYFDLAFTGNGATLETRLVGYEAILPAHQYVLGPDVIGNALATNTKVNGKAVDNGYIMVTNKDGKYQISGTFGDQVLYWTGTLPFVEDPEPTRLTEVLSAQSNKANGQNSLTMNLATPGIHQEFNQETYQQYWVGEGGYLALDIYSDDGYLHDGQYTACAEGGVINAGEFGIGYDTTMEFWGQVYEVKDWGTCWWTVKDGAATAEKILDGLVTVTSREEKVDDKDVTIWTIFWGKDRPEEILFEGAIPTLTKPKKPDGPVNPDYLYTETITVSGEGVENHAFDITDKAGNLRAHVELLMAAGETVYDGSYPSTSYSSQPGQMVDGWVWGDYGGGSYWISDTGEKVLLSAGQYTMVVTKIAEGAYNFTCELFNYNAAGPDFVPGSGGETGTVYDMTDTIAVDCTDAANTLYEDVESHTLVLKDGEEFVAQIKLVRSVGTTDLSGTYTVGEYAHENLIAANGFDLGAMFGMDPGAWVIGSYYVKDGSIVIIEPGETITVTSAGDKTWKFEGSTGYSFTGKLQ